jgi:hypothetical protein
MLKYLQKVISKITKRAGSESSQLMSGIRNTVHNNDLGLASSIFFSLYIESVSPDTLQKLHQQGMRILAPDRIKALAEHLPLIKVRTEDIRFFKDQNIFVFEIKKIIS